MICNISLARPPREASASARAGRFVRIVEALSPEMKRRLAGLIDDSAHTARTPSMSADLASMADLIGQWADQEEGARR